MQISNADPSRKPLTLFALEGQDHEGLWRLRHPHGMLCSGAWRTEEDAQHDCDRWNALRLKERGMTNDRNT